MAKESFFIRKQVPVTDGATEQVPIDLGFVVDALGKSVCRIHNIAVQYGVGYVISGNNTNVAFELGTQSSPTLLTASDRSIISTGNLVTNVESPSGNTLMISDALDVAPQHWTNGYLVAVDQLYLRAGSTNANGFVNIVLECTVETMGSSAAMALSLSQQ